MKTFSTVKSLVCLVTVIITILVFGSFTIASAQIRSNSNTNADGDAHVANCYTIKLELYKNNKASSDYKIKASEISKYKLGISVRTSDVPIQTVGGKLVPCESNGKLTVKYDNYNDASGTHSTPIKTGYFDNETQINGTNFEKAYDLTDPALTTYTYTLIWQGGGRSALSTSINITFTDDKGNTNVNGTATGVNGNGNSANNTPPDPAKDGKDIDTETSVNFNVNLDTHLGDVFNPLSFKSVPELIGKLLNILFILIGLAAVVVIIVGGFRMVTSSGNTEELTKAKKAITWAIVGLIVSLLSFSIVAIIQSLISNK